MKDRHETALALCPGRTWPELLAMSLSMLWVLKYRQSPNQFHEVKQGIKYVCDIHQNSRHDIYAASERIRHNLYE